MSKKNNQTNPIAAYLNRALNKKNTSLTTQPSATKIEKQRITIHLSTELIERLKNVVFWEPGLTITSLTEKALDAELIKLEKKRGNAYPKRTHNLTGGRPITSIEE